MEQIEIRKRASELREAINLVINTFIFDPCMAEYIKELNELQEQCEHEYLDGICIWCGKQG